MVDHIAGIEQTWTITFTSATDFTCAGDTVGSVGTGSRNSAFAPTNPDHARPYFTLPATGWGGTWASGNILSFKTHPATIPIWEKRTGALLLRHVAAGRHAQHPQIPVAPSRRKYSGQFNVRIAKDLHRRLAIEAERQGVSLNAWVSNKLASV
ncbi:MAG: type II toxin-antitoxin system HicB family antitoxin [Magnetococcales bacterium]|nr:type II toxin-antitoxin system HicB family antitoxin [Magnetococcales bacterium]